MIKEKCLVREARDKCQCKECIENRKWAEQVVAMHIHWLYARMQMQMTLEMLRILKEKDGKA